MPWPFAPGEVLTDANLEAVTLPWNACCQLLRTAVSIGDASQTTISFNSVGHVELDDLGWHDPAVNPDRVIPNIAGWYRISGCYTTAASTAYTRLNCLPLKNGAGITCTKTDVMWPGPTESVNASVGFTSRLIQANGTTDYFGVSVFQNSAGSLNGDVSLLVELVRS